MKGKQKGDTHVPRPSRIRKGKYENPYVAERINEIRAQEALMVAATDEYPRESWSMRCKRLWDVATAGMSGMQLHNHQQCTECGGVFLRKEFLSKVRSVSHHDTCRSCRPKVRARLKNRKDGADRRKATAKWQAKNAVASLESAAEARKKAIHAVKKQWRDRTRQNRQQTKRLTDLIAGGNGSGRTLAAYEKRVKLGRYHLAVRKEMEADHANPDKHIADAKWYFDGDDLRAKCGITSHTHNQMTDHVKHVM